MDTPPALGPSVDARNRASCLRRTLGLMAPGRTALFHFVIVPLSPQRDARLLDAAVEHRFARWPRAAMNSLMDGLGFCVVRLRVSPEGWTMTSRPGTLRRCLG